MTDYGQERASQERWGLQVQKAMEMGLCKQEVVGAEESPSDSRRESEAVSSTSQEQVGSEPTAFAEPELTDWVRVQSPRLPEATEQYLVRLATETPDEEVCGFLTRGGSVIPVKNVDANPLRGYRMDVDEMVLALTKHEVVGVYHSHPSGRHWPSQTDTTEMGYWYDQGCNWDYYIVVETGVYRYEHRRRHEGI